MSNVPSGSALQGGTDAYGIVLQPQGTGQLYFGKVFLKGKLRITIQPARRSKCAEGKKVMAGAPESIAEGDLRWILAATEKGLNSYKLR